MVRNVDKPLSQCNWRLGSKGFINRMRGERMGSSNSAEIEL